jgi:hypothetical protein
MPRRSARRTDAAHQRGIHRRLPYEKLQRLRLHQDPRSRDRAPWSPVATVGQAVVFGHDLGSFASRPMSCAGHVPHRALTLRVRVAARNQLNLESCWTAACVGGVGFAVERQRYPRACPYAYVLTTLMRRSRSTDFRRNATAPTAEALPSQNPLLHSRLQLAPQPTSCLEISVHALARRCDLGGARRQGCVTIAVVQSRVGPSAISVGLTCRESAAPVIGNPSRVGAGFQVGDVLHRVRLAYQPDIGAVSAVAQCAFVRTKPITGSSGSTSSRPRG